MARENESWGYKRIQGAAEQRGIPNWQKLSRQHPQRTRHRTSANCAGKQRVGQRILKSHWDVFQEFGLDAITLWFSKLIAYVFEPVSCDNAVVGDAVLGNNDAASCLVMLTVPIRQVPESTTQSSRGPPAARQPLTANFVRQLKPLRR